MQQIGFFGSTQEIKEKAEEKPTQEASYKNLPKSIPEAYELKDESLMHFNHYLKLIREKRKKNDFNDALRVKS